MDEHEKIGGGLFPPRVGERLEKARQAQGLSLDDVAERTRVPRRHLEMIEAGDHSALPAIPYSVGFVKTYARLLGLDPAALSHDFRNEVSSVEPQRSLPEPFEPADPARVPARVLATVALVVALVLGGSYAVWRGGRGEDRAQLAAGTEPVATPQSGAPARTQLAANTVRKPAPGPVVVSAKDPVWVKIYEKGGPTLFQGNMEPGQRYEVPSTATDPQLWTGRPQAIQVNVGATPIPPLGEPDRTIRDVSITREALLARATPALPAVMSPSPVDPQPATGATPANPPLPGA